MTLPRALQSVRRLPSTAATLARTPPPLELLPSGRLTGLVAYVRECTAPDDRVLATWYAPQLYFFAQRAFAGGMVVTFGGHWSGTIYQQRIVDKLRSEPVPLVLVDHERGDEILSAYPIVSAYLEARYTRAGERPFDDREPESGAYTVLVDRRRTPLRTHSPTGLPCYAGIPRPS